MSETRFPPAPGEWQPDVLAVLLSRVFMFGVLFWVAGAYLHGPVVGGIVVAYGISTALFLATWAFAPRFSAKSKPGFLFFFQFLVELLAVTVVFVASGGYESYHGFLFILTIASSGVFFGYPGAIFIAFLSSLIFGVVGVFHSEIHLAGDLITLNTISREMVLMRFFPTVALYFLIALLSADGARRLARTRRELVGATEALSLARFSAESMMKDLPTGLLFFDLNHQLRFWNIPAEGALGKTFKEGLGLRMVFLDVLNNSVLDGLEQQKGNEFVSMDAMAGVKPLRVLYKPLRRDEKILGHIFTLFDLTEEKRVQRLMLRQERMAALGQMSARLAHEIRNPLASISGAAQMLTDSPAAQETDRKLFKLIVAESGRLNRFLVELLDYVKDREPTLRKIEIQSLFRILVQLLEKSPFYKKEIVLIEEIMENKEMEINSDQDILLQVLLNLGLNALEAMEGKPGHLKFSAKNQDEGIRILVSDTGPGMDGNTLSHAMEPFFTTKPHGTGLGLAVCLQAIQSLQGNITLESAPGLGTTITLNLPRDFNVAKSRYGNQG